MKKNDAATRSSQTPLAAASGVAASMSEVAWAGLSPSYVEVGGRMSVTLTGEDGAIVGVSHLSPELSVAPPVLVVTDGDSTLIHQEVINELAAAAGVGAQVEALTSAAMHGHLDFSESLARRVALLKGAPESILDEVRGRLTVMEGARILVDWVHSVGGKFGVVSGGFVEVIAPLIEDLSIDYLVANRLEIQDGVLTGRVRGPIVDAQTKTRCIEEWSGGHTQRAAAVGDGANDIPMLETAGAGIAFCAKPAVRDSAPSYLNVPRLDAVIPLLRG